jgi:hypothetical protein
MEIPGANEIPRGCKSYLHTKRNEMESKTAVDQSPPPQAVIMQMVMGAWVTKVISEVTRLGVPDLVKQHGSMHAAEMVTAGGVQAAPNALERQ